MGCLFWSASAPSIRADLAEARYRRRYRGIVGSAVVLLLAQAAASVGQTVSQITPPTFRPEPPRLEGVIAFSGAPGLEAPPGSDELSVVLSGVVIEGGFSDLAPAATAMERRLVGRPIPVSAIFEAARDLEAAYARAGYVLARVVLPAQRLEDGGLLRLVVVDGFVEEIRLDGVPERVRDFVGRTLAPLRGVRGLGLDEIERRLLLAGDAPGLALRSTLAAGATPGGALLLVEGTQRPVTGFVGFDNTLGDDLGEWVLSTGLEANGALGLAETVYLRASGHPSGDDDGLGGLFTDRPRVRILAGGIVAPLGTDGLTLNLEATQSRETPEPERGVQTASDFDRFSVRLRYPWVRSRAMNASSELIFDATSEDVQLLADAGEFTLSKDRVRALRLSGDANRAFDDGAAAAVRVLGSLGVDALGARGADDVGDGAPLSRQGADADFAKLEASASYAAPLGDVFGFALLGRAQTSFGDPLVSSERIGAASFGELSTFDSGTLGGDSGWVARAELRAPTERAVGGAALGIEPYAFAGTGMLYNDAPTAAEESVLRVSSLGVGLRLSRVFDPRYSNVALAVEFGRAFRDDDEPDENRLTVVASFRF